MTQSERFDPATRYIRDGKWVCAPVPPAVTDRKVEITGPEAHILIDGEPATGCLVDFGLYFHHNCSKFQRTQGAGYGPFFYLPKMEHSR
ncbi:hypothetical protein VNO77_25716 [Canavalia gladiata]|uniref:malate synthase n=1 Tax=Canavalia gladiata TaxID=3824 RepID=A0AAN9QDR8_CANGL